MLTRGGKAYSSPVHKLSVYIQQLRCSLFLESALQPKIANINKNRLSNQIKSNQIIYLVKQMQRH